MRDGKIAVLAIQETHLSSQRLDEVERLFGGSVTICSSPDPENDGGARGVAIVLNKRLTKEMNYEWREVVPERAMLMRLTWSARRTLSILNVYAPNAPREGEAFWRALKEADMGTVDIAMGDWNITYDRLDRLPSGHDDLESGRALTSMLSDMNLVDGWRKENPDSRMFTYMQASTGSQSRIDRIYARRALLSDAIDWEVRESGIPTDHRLISVRIANYQAPFIGKGRWAMPEQMLNDEGVTKAMREEANAFLTKLSNLGTRTPSNNVQTAFQEFKNRLIVCVRNRMKTKLPKAKRNIK
ncbi:DNase I-like protein [Trametes coccinea BRFM310]|uniref:DNase I-like protein n=1 Tax=Trametes coccinea (strain BRFM310) TaxID=1353009 RepID=A0A1Y2IDL5_TRAC3|nr:DNase I-like protein [Trametes coccinea BRFM310]